MKNLEPKALWGYFAEICQIPRPSNKEEKIRKYIRDFGAKHSLETVEDETGNIVIRKPATKGCEHLKPVILQCHVDMVCEKNSDTVHDFDKDPIDYYVDGDWIKAHGTTLGADNGIGVATELAILAADDINHGDLECLFTVGEETGLNGAFGLKEGFLKGKTLINLDSEDDWEIFVGCAGGIDTVAKFKYEIDATPENSAAYRIDVKGLKGGHSGDDINKGLGNANKLLNRILWNGQNDFDLNIAVIDGGNLRNAIAREAYAIVVIAEEEKFAFVDMVNQFAHDFKNELSVQEPNLQVTCSAVDMPESIIDPMTQYELLDALYACPHGVISMSFKMPGIVETSTNLASIKMKEDNIIEITTSQRSDADSLKTDIANMVKTVFELAGADVEQGDGYPGWTPNPNSELLKAAVAAYKKVVGEDPIVCSIHAGLECGLFLEKYPDLDMISYGPTMKGVHSPDEKLSISSTQQYWKIILELIHNV